jgi:preprotein translocase subunit SecA
MQDPEEEAAALARQQEIEQKQLENSMKLNHHDGDAPLVEKKVARNDPCPCGSGKKYKNCCGQSGPKKGAFAAV